MNAGFMPFLSSIIFLLVGCTGLAGEANSAHPITSPSKHDGYFKVGKPYKIKGKWYKPQHDPNYDKVGVASWYGPRFHGKKTANGSIYDKRALTAAHLTLPMPCLVRVTNLENGRSVIVMINDRGPYPSGKSNRIIDLSERAAELLNMKQKGTAKVRVTYLKDHSRRLYAELGIHNDVVTPLHDEPYPPLHLASLPWKNPDATHVATKKTSTQQSPPATPSEPLYVSTNPLISTAHAKEIPPSSNIPLYVQVGAYQSHDNAAKAASTVKRLGSIDIQTTKTEENSLLYRVRVGPVTNHKAANQLLKEVMGTGYRNAVIVQD